MLTRRELMKIGLAGTGYFILGPDGTVSFADDDLPRSPSTVPFQDQLPLPGEIVEFVDPFLDLPEEYMKFWVDVNTTRFFRIASEARKVRFHKNLPPTMIWGYLDVNPNRNTPTVAGSVDLYPADPDPNVSTNILGPTIVQLFGGLGPLRTATYGSAPDPYAPPIGGGFVVRHMNCLPALKDHRGFGVPRTTVHLHGGHHLARADGFPENIENRPGIQDGFPCVLVMEPPGFYPSPFEPTCSSAQTPVSDMGPDGRPVTERQVLDYYYPILDPGELDLMRSADPGHPEPADPTERPSTQWYHDHLLDFTGPNAYRGLAGFVLCFDELDSNDENDPRNDELDPTVTYPKPLRLPSAPYDIPLVIQDKRFDANGNLVFSTFDHDGFLGDKFVVNGKIQPYMKVQRRKYRFRVLNASNARLYRIFLNDGKAGGQSYRMTMIATEGGLLSKPIRQMPSFLIAMAERIEVVIDFSQFPSGTKLYLENRLPQDDGRKPDDGLLSQGSGNKLVQFIVEGDPPFPDNSEVPNVLRPFAPIPQEERDRAYHRYFRFDRSEGAWTINGRLAGDLERPAASPKRGQPEIWHLENNSGGWWHPIHIHSEFFRTLKRNGRTPSEPVDGISWLPGYEKDGFVKKDTILLRDNETVEVFLKFRDHLGPFVFHCHNMEHEDMAMMARFDVVKYP